VAADVLGFEWDLGDGNTATGSEAVHVYADDGVYTVTLTVSDDDGGFAQSTTEVTVAPVTEMVGQYVFYNNSAFDGNTPGADMLDDGAIAPDKVALRPGGIASFANYTSFHRGINGIMVDIDDLPVAIDLATAFDFRMGNSNNLAEWSDAPEPVSMDVRWGEGENHSDRVTIIFSDNAIENRWLEVTVLGGPTALAEDYVFYFGNAVAEAGNSNTDAEVDTIDLLLARNNLRNVLNPAPIDFPYDFNRDQRVNATDVLLARNNQTNFLGALKLLDLSSPQQTAVPTETELEAALSEMAWIGEYAQDRSSSRPARAHSATAETVDELLATYWL